MRHLRPLTAQTTTTTTTTGTSPFGAKLNYIAGLIDAGIAFVMQKDGGAL